MSFLRGHHPALRHPRLRATDLIDYVRIHEASLESLTLSEMEQQYWHDRDRA